jgi:hypothetical protein
MLCRKASCQFDIDIPLLLAFSAKWRMRLQARS